MAVRFLVTSPTSLLVKYVRHGRGSTKRAKKNRNMNMGSPTRAFFTRQAYTPASKMETTKTIIDIINQLLMLMDALKEWPKLQKSSGTLTQPAMSSRITLS